jgi:hypothetical protein
MIAKFGQPWDRGRVGGVGHGETVGNWAIIPNPLRNLRQRRGEHRWGNRLNEEIGDV